MRQLTAFASYFDNIGEPLVGRAKFYNLDGSPAEVFGLDNSLQHFVSLGSSVFTDSSGHLEPQVFLDDHDYLVVFDKYVGNARMTEDVEEESWEEQGSAVDKYDVFGITLEGDAIRSIKTISELSALEPVADGEIVQLLGYNTAGDKEPIFYTWHRTSTKQDNRGSVIQLNDGRVGRWEFVSCPLSLDVRHFGAFPMSGFEVNPTQRYAIQRAMSYASANHCGIYFPSTTSAVYYDISNLTLRNVDSNPSARVFAATGTQRTVIRDVIAVYCDTDRIDGVANGIIRIKSDEVRTSWAKDSGYAYCEPYVRLIMDAPISGSAKNFLDIEVDIETYTRGCKFTNCTINSIGKIDAEVTLEHCDIMTSWFAYGYDWRGLTMVNCRVLLRNCNDANLYVLLKNKVYEANYGDLGEQTLSNASLLPNCIVENAVFDMVTLKGNTELHNVSGSILVSGSPFSLNFVDCWVNFADETDVVLYDVQWRRGNVDSGSRKVQVIHSLYLNNVDVNARFYTPGIAPDYIGCFINKTQENGKDVNYVGCRINAEIIQRPESGSYDGYDGKYMAGKFIDNIFLDAGVLSLTPETNVDYDGVTVGVVGVYVGNCSDHNFVDDTNWAGWASELQSPSTHINLTYEGNHGGCPQQEVTETRNISYTCIVATRGQEDTPWTFETIPDGVAGNTGLFVVLDSRSGDGRTVASSLYWMGNIYNMAVDVTKAFWLKNIRRRGALLAEGTFNGVLRTDDHGLYVNSFKVDYPVLRTEVLANSDTAYLTALQPYRFEYTGVRLFTDSDMDKKHTALFNEVYRYEEDATRFSGTLQLKFYVG